jgi:hypothetical protein
VRLPSRQAGSDTRATASPPKETAHGRLKGFGGPGAVFNLLSLRILAKRHFGMELSCPLADLLDTDITERAGGRELHAPDAISDPFFGHCADTNEGSPASPFLALYQVVDMIGF